jgi:hypothetical protein
MILKINMDWTIEKDTKNKGVATDLLSGQTLFIKEGLN